MSAAATSGGVRPDRAAAVRAAMRSLVARNGFHGASMGAVARRAGVATGTAYVHYGSKDELVIAAYLESKERLGAAAIAAVDPGDPPPERFQALWKGVYRHLAADVNEARFLIQVDGSPYAAVAHEAAMSREDDPLVLAASEREMATLLEPLPLEVLYEIGLAPAVRLAAREVTLSDRDLNRVARACWRAVARPT